MKKDTRIICAYEKKISAIKSRPAKVKALLEAGNTFQSICDELEEMGKV